MTVTPAALILDGAAFELVGVRDPYGFASATELSLFRRPLPATDLRFLSTVMWDRRETVQKGSAAAIAPVDPFDSRPALTYSRDDSPGQPCAGVPTRPGGPPWSRCS
jgi:hypothetical protein